MENKHKLIPSNLARSRPGYLPPFTSSTTKDEERSIRKLKHVAASLPYKIESEEEMQRRLNVISARLAQAVESRDYDYGLLQWDSMLASWMELKYPLPRKKRIALAKLFYQICVVPGMPHDTVSACMDTFSMLTRSKKKLGIQDLRLPWRPVYDILSRDLFFKRRQFEFTQTAYNMAYVAESARKFFSPACIDEMLQEFIPHIIGNNLDRILANQYYLVTFLPLSHPQRYLPTMMRLWGAVNSYAYDERMLSFISKLSEMHVDPTISDPKVVEQIPMDWGEAPRVQWPKQDLSDDWKGLYKDVGIFAEDEWSFIMCKCLASMQIPLADAGSLTTGPSTDGQAGYEIGRLPRCTWRIASLARIIVYSMTPDGVPAPASGAATPFTPGIGSPLMTPLLGSSPASISDYFSAPLMSKTRLKERKYLGGSKALDSLSKLIMSCESFFHPTNSGNWTGDLTAFVKYIVFEFNKRWHEELQPDSKVPKARRLTPLMRRELVRCLRTVCLLSIFSSDSTTTGNVQSALKSMISMEPDLILPSILERAVEALETLTETQRTLAIIKGLSAVCTGMTSRDMYYPGAKHISPVLELLIPGIDLNDPTKTICTSSLIKDVAQFIKFGDLTEFNFAVSGANGFASPLQAAGTPSYHLNSAPGTPSRMSGTSTPTRIVLPVINIGYGFTGDETPNDSEPRLSDHEEDALVKESTSTFSNFVTSWFHRVIKLMESLPEEGQPGTRAGGEEEAGVIDNIGSTSMLICQHLSDQLFDLVLNQLHEYATTCVRPNALRAIHQLAECLANANPKKTLERFMPHCLQHIKTELEHGASSQRTTSSSEALPSDATLHWNLAILRGAMYKDGRELLPYKQELKETLMLLVDKTLSKRGYQWGSRLLYSVLLACTNTYPLEDRFVNPDEWNGTAFLHSHHKKWGKLYRMGETFISWHVPSQPELDFVMELFDDVVSPTLGKLEDLLADNVTRDLAWRSDFCRLLSYVQEAFSGIAGLMKEDATKEEKELYYANTDLPESLPEMVAWTAQIEVNYPLRDEKDLRRQKLLEHRRRFREFLLKSSQVLRQQGEENTVDAIHMVISSFRTYLLENGAPDIEDWGSLRNRYSNEKNVARNYAGQQEWPRSLWILHARFYQATRMRANNIERIRTKVEDSIIDELIEWSMYIYATVRIPAQNLLSRISEVYDGVRRRVLPKVYEALAPGTDDDRLKGALYLLHYSNFGKYAVTGITTCIHCFQLIQAPDLRQFSLFIKHVFACQHNEKPSIQNIISAIFDSALNNFIERCHSIYRTHSQPLIDAAEEILNTVPEPLRDRDFIKRNFEHCRNRENTFLQSLQQASEALLAIGNSTSTHWRYHIVALRIIRTLIQKDVTNTTAEMKYLIPKVTDDHPSIRYYSQRAIMKMTRYIKIRTFTQREEDISLQINRSPLRRMVPIHQPSEHTTDKYLADFMQPLDWVLAQDQPLLQDKMSSGWLAWEEQVSLRLAPSSSIEWEPASQAVFDEFRLSCLKPEFWEALKVHYAEENQSSSVNWDNVSFVKTICEPVSIHGDYKKLTLLPVQVLGNSPWEAFLPTLEKLLADKEQNKQRAAAELLAGVIAGSKNWDFPAQNKLKEWLSPQLPTILGQNLKTDTLGIWTSFIEYTLGNRDPRRIFPQLIIEFLMRENQTMEYNQELSFDAIRICCFTQSMAEALGWRFRPWIGPIVDRHWQELASDHDEVRAYIADALQLFDKIMWRPKPSVPTVEVVVRECQTLSENDIMSIRNFPLSGRFQELLPRFAQWRTERLPGARAIHSTYDRAATTVLKWLFMALHDIQATSTYDYIVPFVPELLHMSELNDNVDLASRAGYLLTRTCGVSPPRELIPQFLEAIFTSIKESPSWRIRLKALPLLQVFYFRQMSLISEVRVIQILEVICTCLDDENIVVREMAATTLSGILRCSPRQSVITLKELSHRATHSS
ncbi:hypothetical protein FRC20_007837 [Serendipita sp. 405]|nr:hypothetical protein FRC20_007837 [Serendipita sp. 405]